MGLTPKKVSNHITSMKKCGLVRNRGEGWEATLKALRLWRERVIYPMSVLFLPYEEEVERALNFYREELIRVINGENPREVFTLGERRRLRRLGILKLDWGRNRGRKLMVAPEFAEKLREEKPLHS